MTVGDLIEALQTLNSGNDAFVSLFKADHTGEMFEIDAVRDNNGHAQLDIYEDESEEDLDDVEETTDGPFMKEDAQASVDAFEELCARRGITTEEKDRIWNAMAAVAYEQIWEQQGAFYNAINPLFESRQE